MARLALYGSSRQPADEVALKREEHDKRDQHGNEGPRRKHVPCLTSLAYQRGKTRGNNRHICSGAEKHECDQ